MTRADFILVTLSFIALPFSYLYLWQPSEKGQVAHIQVHNKTYKTISLKKDQTLTITGILGNSTLKVDSGRIRFLHSPCKGKYCVHSGWLKDGGEFAACLPNQVSVEILGLSQRFDAINF